MAKQWRQFADCRPSLLDRVIFGEGNRGNVFNLLNQIASGKFMMVGGGENRKSMAYIANVVAFLEACIGSDKKYALFNYVDTPDLTMNALVTQVRSTLNGQNGLRLPLWLGMFVGHLADLFASLTGKTLPVSAIRVKKFTSTTAFKSSKSNLQNFEPPFDLLEGIDRTLESEFISPDPNREIFYSE